MSQSKSQALLPLFEFPTKVVIIDDNIEFIKGLQMLSANYGVELIPFQDPRKAAAYLQEKNYCKFAKKYLTPEENAEIFYNEINLHFNTLYQEAYDPTRFEEISALIIDYAMPGMNGQ